MDRETFTKHLVEAADLVLPFSRRFLVDILPDEYRFLIVPNASYDGNPLVDDEQIFPKESLGEGKYLGPFEIEQTIDFLHRNEKVPEWVNVMVHSYDAKFTYLELLCCGRFTAGTDCLYHIAEGYPPFHGLGPNLPGGWESVETSGKFQLNWKQNLKRNA